MRADADRDRTSTPPALGGRRQAPPAVSRAAMTAGTCGSHRRRTARTALGEPRLEGAKGHGRCTRSIVYHRAGCPLPEVDALQRRHHSARRGAAFISTSWASRTTTTRSTCRSRSCRRRGARRIDPAIQAGWQVVCRGFRVLRASGSVGRRRRFGSGERTAANALRSRRVVGYSACVSPGAAASGTSMDGAHVCRDRP